MQRELELQGYVELVDYEVDSEEFRAVSNVIGKEMPRRAIVESFGPNRFKAAILAVSQSIIEP